MFSRDEDAHERVEVEVFKKDLDSFAYWKWTRSPGGKFFMFWIMALIFCSSLLVLPWVVDQLLWADGSVGKYIKDDGVAEPIVPGSLVMLDTDWVVDSQSARQVEGVAQHELGHVFYWQLFSDAQRARWDVVSADLNSSTYPLYDFSGRYGSTNVEEDFAEMFRAARYCGWDVGALPTAERREFFAEEVVPRLPATGRFYR